MKTNKKLIGLKNFYVTPIHFLEEIAEKTRDTCLAHNVQCICVHLPLDKSC